VYQIELYGVVVLYYAHPCAMNRMD
jgi:hypothetical protein